MSTLQSAPPAVAPKTDFIRLEPFDESGPQILTIVGHNYIPKQEFEDQKTKEKYFAPAVEFFFSADTPAGPRFVKTWPKTYSLGERAFYHKLYKAATGKAPVAGTTPSDLNGCGIQATIEVGEKTGRKGTKYKACSLDTDTVAPLLPQLRSAITPLAKLKPALDALLAKKDDKAPADTNTDNAPF